MTGFVIHALHVGGGTLALAPLPGAGGEYAADMAHLADWKPALVISMTTGAEMVASGAGDLAAQVQAAGTRWIGLPVADYGVPRADQATDWVQASAAARAALGGGGRVLVHCRGGCGRSGMAVLRLMIEAGEVPERALARLRALRPCAVETGAQMAWALRGRVRG
ncbi:dual specificity protein phosphatase family protein [Roseovarius autotrophicus]|uniref:phosphatase domain-containing protein n=1 Tax=Roseovarius autotrophicus TaxID=2824121 RepID=UPI0019E12C45|nr:dual specificity protein phosphatase family protein [Roseovarius autotrophicus]MBE0452891.1 dual specificity protein phosphatase family protein [Roseovarius sp.]